MLSVLAAFAAILSIPLLLKLYRALTSPLRHVPGPFLARFTRLWELAVQINGRFEEVNIALHERYGPVVRLAPDRYSLASPAAVKTVYGHGSKFVKTAFYDPFGGCSPVHDANLFSQKDATKHAASRRRVAQLYAMSSLIGYEDSIDRCTATLEARFAGFALHGDTVPMREWLQFYAYDVIGEITVGRTFGVMDAGHDSGILHVIDRYLVYGSRVGLLPELHLLFGAIARPLQPLVPVTREIEGLINAQVAAQAEGKAGGETNTFMTKLLGMLNEGRVQPADMNNSIGGNIGAGSDTTAISLSAVVLELARHPDCATKLRAEIDQLESEGKLSDPITFKEAQQMPYLQAVLKEALRVHPAVGQIMPRYVPAEGVEVDGQFFPAGSVVGVNAWVVHRNKDIFGSDANEFRPERWLESQEKSHRMDQYNLTFGAGSRTCIGKNISLLEMNKVLPQLYRKFDFELAHVAPHTNDWFVKQNFKCRIKTRRTART